MDPQNSAFPIPVTREVGGFRFQEVAMVDYPFFADVRPPGLNEDHPISNGVPQITMTWASPLRIDAESNSDREVIELLSSSEGAWISDSMDVLPRVTDDGVSGWQAEGETGTQLMGAVISGRFESFYAGKPSPLMPETPEPPPEQESAAKAASDTPLTVGSVIERSPESARLVIYSSNDFLTDQILGTMSSMTGAQYLGPLELIANTMDWALEDGGLLGIRSHGHFNRSLPPLEKDEQLFWEYLNYALALFALAAIGLWQRRNRLARQQTYLDNLGEAA
jgi:ABC-2 type transport system permease protein